MRIGEEGGRGRDGSFTARLLDSTERSGVADVFLSYARNDIWRAKQIADGLRSEGLDVFFDAGLRIGEEWDDGLEERLEEMPSVAVLWSEKSRKSHWVRSETRRGIRLRKLAPARI